MTGQTGKKTESDVSWVWMVLFFGRNSKQLDEQEILDKHKPIFICVCFVLFCLLLWVEYSTHDYGHLYTLLRKYITENKWNLNEGPSHLPGLSTGEKQKQNKTKE